MIVCSTCKHANMAGAMFCAECGAQLVGKDSLITQTITTDNFRRVTLGNSEDGYQPFEYKLSTSNLVTSWHPGTKITSIEEVPRLSDLPEPTLRKASDPPKSVTQNWSSSSQQEGNLGQTLQTLL